VTSSAQLCEVCRAQEGCEPAARRLAEWAHLDVTVQHAPGTAPGDGLVLIAHPPAAGTLAGRIALYLDGTEVGAVTASPCASCRTATLDYVHVAADYRRLGFGRTLVAAAVAPAAVEASGTGGLLVRPPWPRSASRATGRSAASDVLDRGAAGAEETYC
jgi:GNAT superfamily N-acetyltransferase